MKKETNTRKTMKRNKIWQNVGAGPVSAHLNNKQGITLIALVITIIVLLILAGITINLTIGEDGIIRRAQEAGKNYVNAAEEEQRLLEEFEQEADNIIANVTGGSTQTKTGKLTEIITAEDYGKTINYSVTVNSTTLSDWKVLYNDGTNIYIILSSYLPNVLIPEATGMTKSTSSSYVAYWTTSTVSTNTEAVATLTNTANWSEFAEGIGGSTATGSPTGEMLMDSYNAKNNTTLAYTDYSILETENNSLYVPHTSIYDNCYGYWLASPDAVRYHHLWFVGFGGDVELFELFDYGNFALRPVVCLRSDITGTVGDTVTISE